MGSKTASAATKQSTATPRLAAVGPDEREALNPVWYTPARPLLGLLLAGIPPQYPAGELLGGTPIRICQAPHGNARAPALRRSILSIYLSIYLYYLSIHTIYLSILSI